MFNTMFNTQRTTPAELAETLRKDALGNGGGLAAAVVIESTDELADVLAELGKAGFLGFPQAEDGHRAAVNRCKAAISVVVCQDYDSHVIADALSEMSEEF